MLFTTVSANVIGGSPSAQGRFSAHAVITPTNLPACAGVVLNPNHVMTAASCILTADNTLPAASIFSVRVGMRQIFFKTT